MTGIIPTVIPTLTKTWNTNIAAIPVAMRAPFRSLALAAINSSLQMITRKAARTRMAPTNPSCSPTAVKMKSVSCSGTYSKFV